MITRPYFRFFIIAAALVAAGCSHGGVVPSGGGQMVTPQSVSPAMVAPAPMAKTAILPSSEMRSPVQTADAVLPLSYTQLSGTATKVAASPDGSFWALSDQPSGADKFIWHFANGSWTNISGLAAYLAVGPDGTLYVANSGGGIYRYNSSGTWNALGGGASAIPSAWTDRRTCSPTAAAAPIKRSGSTAAVQPLTGGSSPDRAP